MLCIPPKTSSQGRHYSSEVCKVCQMVTLGTWRRSGGCLPNQCKPFKSLDFASDPYNKASGGLPWFLAISPNCSPWPTWALLPFTPNRLPSDHVIFFPTYGLISHGPLDSTSWNLSVIMVLPPNHTSFWMGNIRDPRWIFHSVHAWGFWWRSFFGENIL